MKLNLSVVWPCENYTEALALFMKKLQADKNPNNLEYPEYYLDSPDRTLQTLQEATKTAADRKVSFRKSLPTYSYFIMRNYDLLGAFYITPTTNQQDAITAYGNIGYVVNPDFRRMGVASFAVSNALGICRNSFKMSEVVIGVYESNIGSKRTIEKAGGQAIKRIWRKSDEPLERNGVWDIYYAFQNQRS